VPDASSLLGAGRAAVLLLGFTYAAAQDLRTREVPDGLWQLLAVIGAIVGAVALAPGGALALVLWAIVAALALEHLFPWDEAVPSRRAALVPALEIAAFAGAIVAVGVSAAVEGFGASAVPLDVVAALASVVLARTLFELGVLYGGADAKALIVTGLLVPLFASPIVYGPPSTATVLGVLPFSVTLLTDAALLSVAVPLALAVRNVARGEFAFPRGFTGYTLDVEELPHRFVWVRDPALGEDTLADDAETSQEDTRRRIEVAAELRRRGVSRVWVTPQLPFLVLMTAGAFAALLAGNLLLDLFAAL
jgi:archaeal preflagellin peptidase FlaK